VLNKERDTGTYRLSAYYLAKVLAEVPLMMVLPFVYAVITYWMVRYTTSNSMNRWHHRCRCSIFFVFRSSSFYSCRWD